MRSHRRTQSTSRDQSRRPAHERRARLRFHRLPAADTASTGLIALIGAGPSGLAAARNLQRHGIAFAGLRGPRRRRRAVEHRQPAQHGLRVGAPDLLASAPPSSPSSRWRESVADYPSHRELRRYFRDFADHFELREHYHFGTEVRPGRAASATARPAVARRRHDPDGAAQRRLHAGVVIANGTLSEPSMPDASRATFDGELLHTSAYKQRRAVHGQAGADRRRRQLGLRHRGRRGALRAQRRHLACAAATTSCPSTSSASRPTRSAARRPLPPGSSRRSTARCCKWFTGDPVRFGFPKPDYKMYESHPVVNSLVLYHVGHGDIRVTPRHRALRRRQRALQGRQRARLRPDRAAPPATSCTTPSSTRRCSNWQGMAPELYLNIFTAAPDNLFVLGMIEASGIGWQGRYEQAELVARFLKARPTAPAARPTRFDAAQGRPAARPVAAATSTSSSSAWRTTSTRTPTARAVRARPSQQLS